MTVKTENIRNITLAGHSGSGKTILIDALLLNSGKINRLGSIQDGSTVSDYTKEEIDHKGSLRLSMANLNKDDVKLNFIDAPGAVDFIGELAAAIHVTESVIISVSPSSGPEVGTDYAWDYAKEHKSAVFFAINMLDKDNSDFDGVQEKLIALYGDKVLPLQMPVAEGPSITSIVDVLKKKMLVFDDMGNYKEEAVPADMNDKVNAAYEKLVEIIAESDDALLEKFFEEGTLSAEEVNAGLKKAVRNRDLFPLLALAGNKMVGISRLGEVLKALAPSPADLDDVVCYEPGTNDEISRKVDESEPDGIFIFKCIYEQHVGEMFLFKVMSGKLTSATEVKNVRTNSSERLGILSALNGKQREEMEEMVAGDLGAIVKLKDSHACDTLSYSKDMVQYAEIKFPEPLIRVAVEATEKNDDEKIGSGLTQIFAEDPTFRSVVDSELKQTIVSAMGDTHLDVNLKKIEARYNIEINQIEPKIPYRETIRKKAEGHYKHKKQSGGAGQFGEVYLRLEPQERGKGIEFISELVGMNVDRAFVPSVEKGVKQATVEGPLTSSKVIDIKVAFYDGKQHPVDSKDIAFQIAGRGAFKEAFEKADPILLEPIYELEVKIPEDYMGDIMGDISSRRGKVLGMDSEGHNQIIKAQVPLANLYKYTNTLKSISQGRGMFRQKFSHYEYVPREIQEKVVAAHKTEEE